MNTIAIWNLYAIDVERFILSKVQDECVSKDLLQEVFLRVHVNKHRLKESDKVKSWLFSIARNIVVDYYRKKGTTGSGPDGGNGRTFDKSGSY